MRHLAGSLALVLILVVIGTVQADQDPDLYLTKIVVRPAEPTKKGRHRGVVKLNGVTPGYHLPDDFRFDPVGAPLSIHVGGARLFSGPGEGVWKQITSHEWTYKEKGEQRWKMRLDFSGRSEFSIRGKRLDLLQAKGPADCDVYLSFGSTVLGVRTSGKATDSGWKWVRGPSSMPSKAPGTLPPSGGGQDDDPPDTGPVSFQILADGKIYLFERPGNWQHGLVVTSAGILAREWGSMLGSAPPPAVDFGQDQVVLFFVRGTGFSVFNVVRTATGVRIDYRTSSISGMLSGAYRAISLPRSAGSVTLNPI